MGFLIDEFPDIFLHLHPVRNKDLDFYQLKSQSHKKIWWYCEKDPNFSHFFEDNIANRTKHGEFRCQICESAGGKRKDLMSHWDYQHYIDNKVCEAATIPTLYDYGINSRKKAYWKCPNGHSEPNPLSIVSKTSRGMGKKQKTAICTRCHSIAHTHPEISKLYDTGRNEKNIWDLSAGCSDEVYWICDKGHSYPMKVNVKIRDFGKWAGNGCSICLGRLIIPEINSFAVKHPILLKEWDWEENEKIGISPYHLGSGYSQNVYWICRLHGTYPASIGNRTNKSRQTGCPDCKSQTSRNELRIYFEFKAIFGSVTHRDKSFGSEIDVYLPKFKLGIEYDGAFYHKNKIEGDKKKIQDLNDKGIQLIRVREKPLVKIGYNDVVVEKNKLFSHTDFIVLVKKVIKILSGELSEDLISRCQNYFKSGTFLAEDEYTDTVINRFRMPKDESLAFKYPEIASEWDYEKNFPYGPSIISPGSIGNASGKLFYWKCWENSDHDSYPMPVYSRTGKNKSGCPYCSGRYATANNNLELKYPEHAKMFDRAKNFSDNGEQLFASMIKPYSGVTYNWICPNGHAFSHTPDELVRKKDYLGCNTCRDIAISNGTHEFNNQKFDHNEIIELYLKAVTYEDIAKQVGCSTGNVGKIIAQFKRDNGIKVQTKVTDAVFCKELNRHFLSPIDAKLALNNLGYTADNILSVLRRTQKFTSGFSFVYSWLSDEEIIKQDPANFVEFVPGRNTNSSQAVRCIELNLVFESKSAAVTEMKKNGYPPFIQRTLNKALKTGGVAGGYHWELMKDPDLN